MIYAVGDIQGCYDSFCRLLDACSFDEESDRLWLTGDLVNRGPQSLETLRRVKSLGKAAVTVLGNHDLYLLMQATETAKRSNKDDTLSAILKAPDREELLFWLRQQPLCHLEDNYCLVHAGLLPSWTAVQAKNLAAEAEAVLRGDDYLAFMKEMWGSEPLAWSDDLSSWERLRVIVNALTRLRFCTPDGTMNFSEKGQPKDAPAGHKPWFSIPNRQSKNSIIIAGHWSALGLYLRPNLLCLDSGCLWGGKLSAVRLHDRRVYQVSHGKNEFLPSMKKTPPTFAKE